MGRHPFQHAGVGLGYVQVQLLVATLTDAVGLDLQLALADLEFVQFAVGLLDLGAMGLHLRLQFGKLSVGLIGLALRQLALRDQLVQLVLGLLSLLGGLCLVPLELRDAFVVPAELVVDPFPLP